MICSRRPVPPYPTRYSSVWARLRWWIHPEIRKRHSFRHVVHQFQFDRDLRRRERRSAR